MDIFVLWRGTLEAFKNELRARRKDNELIIKTIIDGRGRYAWKLDEEDRLPHRKDSYKCNEVRAWLLTKGINTNIENIELTMPPEYLPSVQGDSVSIFNSINERGRKVDEKILKEIKNSEKKRKP